MVQGCARAVPALTFLGTLVSHGPSMILDTVRRPLEELRVSVTDRCNLRCTYCMPLPEYDWLEKSSILSFEEISRLVQVFEQLGVREVRLTGGEPLVRRDLHRLVAMLAGISGLNDLTLTTNGVLLEEQAAALRQAGLKRINISLDTLDRQKFIRIAQRDELERVLAGVEAARREGFSPIKINMVVERGVNEDEILPMVRFCREKCLSLRLIEYMDVGNSNDWSMTKVVPKAEILKVLSEELGLEPVGHREHASDPAELFRLSRFGSSHPEPIDGAEGLDRSSADGSRSSAMPRRGVDVGVIASVTQPFCGGCTRARLTADGKLVTCLFASAGTDLKSLLRSGATDLQLAERIAAVWSGRGDRFSEERLAALHSTAGYHKDQFHKIEMITLGG